MWLQSSGVFVLIHHRHKAAPLWCWCSIQLFIFNRRKPSLSSIVRPVLSNTKALVIAEPASSSHDYVLSFLFPKACDNLYKTGFTTKLFKNYLIIQRDWVNVYSLSIKKNTNFKITRNLHGILYLLPLYNVKLQLFSKYYQGFLPPVPVHTVYRWYTVFRKTVWLKDLDLKPIQSLIDCMWLTSNTFLNLSTIQFPLL